jgi:hypothetical protein
MAASVLGRSGDTLRRIFPGTLNPLPAVAAAQLRSMKPERAFTVRKGMFAVYEERNGR